MNGSHLFVDLKYVACFDCSRCNLAEPVCIGISVSGFGGRRVNNQNDLVLAKLDCGSLAGACNCISNCNVGAVSLFFKNCGDCPFCVACRICVEVGNDGNVFACDGAVNIVDSPGVAVAGRSNCVAVFAYNIVFVGLNIFYGIIINGRLIVAALCCCALNFDLIEEEPNAVEVDCKTDILSGLTGKVELYPSNACCKLGNGSNVGEGLAVVRNLCDRRGGSKDAPVCLINDVHTNRRKLVSRTEIDGGECNAVFVGVCQFCKLIRIEIGVVVVGKPYAVVSRDRISGHAVGQVCTVVGIGAVDFCVCNFFARCEVYILSGNKQHAAKSRNKSKCKNQCKCLFHRCFPFFSWE